MKKQSIVKLSKRDKQTIQSLLKKGRVKAAVARRGQILLGSDEGETDQTIAHRLGVHWTTVKNVRKRYCAGGLKRALYDASRPGGTPVLDDTSEATLVAIACSEAPEGRTHWTVELLREKLIADEVVPTISVGTIHAHLSARGIKPWREKNVVHSQSDRHLHCPHGASH